MNGLFRIVALAGLYSLSCVILQTSSGLLSGTYDEEESAASFQEALQAWRKPDVTKPAKPNSACVYCITFVAIILLKCT